MIDLRDKRIGIVLSGGGAKGAYQVGMFRALRELGLDRQIRAMSGCSIGAYAEAIYAVRGIDEYCRFLYGFQDMFHDGDVLSEAETAAAKAAVADGRATLEQFCSERRFWRYEGRALREYVKELVSDRAIENSGYEMSVCAYSLEKERPVYFKLGELSDDEKASAIIGSGCLQFLLEPVLLRGQHLVDGGIVPNICRSPAPADKIPLQPMLMEEVDFILINFLIARDSVNTKLIPAGTDFLELRPSAPLEAYPGAGTLDFSPEKLAGHEKLGYEDTLRCFRQNCIF